jgi:hypothetical protein
MHLTWILVAALACLLFAAYGAFSVGSCCGCGAPAGNCGTCGVPSSNLTIAWVNPIGGNGSTTLVYSATGPHWTSACIGNILTAQVTCSGNSLTLAISIYNNVGCTGGISQTCSSASASPNKLTLSSSQCSPTLSFTWTTGGGACPSLFGDGYTSFTVT